MLRFDKARSAMKYLSKFNLFWPNCWRESKNNTHTRSRSNVSRRCKTDRSDIWRPKFWIFGAYMSIYYQRQIWHTRLNLWHAIPCQISSWSALRVDSDEHETPHLFTFSNTTFCGGATSRSRVKAERLYNGVKEGCEAYEKSTHTRGCHILCASIYILAAPRVVSFPSFVHKTASLAANQALSGLRTV